MEKIKKSYYYF